MQTLSVDQLVGKKFGQYRVARLLGRSRLSAVYLAQHPAYANAVAVTVFIIPEQFSDEARDRFSQRFNREAALLTTLDHPHIMPVYEYGEQFGYPYLVTPYMMHGSLADVIKQQGRCNQDYTREVLDQVAAGLQYTHDNNVVHGTLKPSNIVFSSEKAVLVAGFGLMHILQMRGVERSQLPYAHLLSVANTYLASPEYVAPEVVQGQPVDARSDIYALGIIIFEMLSGRPPFTGTSALEVVQQHVQQLLPSLRSRVPEIPVAMESVVNHALSRIPAQRFQTAQEFAEAFALVCAASAISTSRSRGSDSRKTVATAPQASTASSRPLQETPREGLLSVNWQLTPPIMTRKLTSVQADGQPVNPAKPAAEAKPTTAMHDSWQLLPPVVTGHLASINPTANVQGMQEGQEVRPLAAPAPSEIKVGASPAPVLMPPWGREAQKPPTATVPFVTSAEAMPTLASTTIARDSALLAPPTSNTYEWGMQEPPGPAEMDLLAEQALAARAKSRKIKPAKSQKQPRSAGRRRVVAMLAAGGALAAGVTLVAVNRHLLPIHIMEPATKAQNQPVPQSNQGQGTGQGSTPAPASTKQTSSNPSVGHTGTVVGSGSLTANTSMPFNNPADGQASLLIHLPGGTFVAYEKACTHEQVPVYYDPASHMLVCPAHGSVFDPAQASKVMQGPAQTPLAHVAIRVNTDGTITTA